jgi:signal transduction histidine kinase
VLHKNIITEVLRPDGRDLTSRFLIAGSVVTAVATVVAAIFVGNLTEMNALYHKAAATALFMDNVVEPALQGLTDGNLSLAEIERVDAILNEPQLAERIPHFEVWLSDGTVAYSKSRELIGDKFTLPAPAREALVGQIEVTKADLGAGEHQARGFQSPYLEIYAPLHEVGTGNIFAVMELHEDFALFQESAATVVGTTWAIVFGAMLALFGTMYLIVRGGSKTIDAQNHELALRLEETRQLAEHNGVLHMKAIDTAHLRVELHENLLRSIGSDLHDGPSQLLAYASLKVESLRRIDDEDKRLAVLADLETKLRDAQDEIRDMATGFVLPEIEHLSLDTIVTEAVSYSERRMGISALLEMDTIDVPCTRAFKMCLFRFIQEGLNNVWSHGDEAPANIAVSIASNNLRCTISNRIAPVTKPSRPRRGLGIRALKVRAESLGGSVSLVIAAGVAELHLLLPLETADA